MYYVEESHYNADGTEEITFAWRLSDREKAIATFIEESGRHPNMRYKYYFEQEEIAGPSATLWMVYYCSADSYHSVPSLPLLTIGHPMPMRRTNAS